MSMLFSSARLTMELRQWVRVGLLLVWVLVPCSWSFLVLPPVMRSSTMLSPSSLGLFSIDFSAKSTNMSANASREAEKDGEEDGELSQWVEGLKQWPRYPTASDPSSSSSSTLQEGQGSTPVTIGTATGRSNPLSNLMNVLDIASQSASTNSTIFTLADQLFRSVQSQQEGEVSSEVLKGVLSQSLVNATTVEELIEREEWLENLQRSIGVGVPFASTTDESTTNASSTTVPLGGLARLSLTQGSAIASTTSSSTSNSTNLGKAAEGILRDATARIEFLVSEASLALSPNSVQDLIDRTSQLFNGTSTNVEAITNDIVQAAESVAKNRGLDVPFAQERARETTRYAATFVNVANGLYAAGYAHGTTLPEKKASAGAISEESSMAQNTDASTAPRPLFADFKTAQKIEAFQYEAVVLKGAEMGSLAGAIYEDALEKTHLLGHALVANGTTADVAWMVTDSLDTTSRYLETPLPVSGDNADRSTGDSSSPLFVRTITIRGFDASDDSVDRESLLNVICSPHPKPISSAREDSSSLQSIGFHSGLLETADAIYQAIRRYIEWAPPNQKIVLNGHSIGGSLSVLVLLLMTAEFGADYVQDRILRVYTHGSPPIADLTRYKSRSSVKFKSVASLHECPVLQLFGLPSDIVFGYIQPYDPIVRFMTDYDPLYPLVDDLGKDDVTLYSSGPRRSLRPITRVILSSWDGWPEFRGNWRSTEQRFQSVGIQHLLLPDVQRYLTDRFVSPNVGVPPTEEIVRVSSSELLPALNSTFPLDVFQISLIPQAVRSFLHHFFPAYETSVAAYAAKIQRKQPPPKADRLPSRNSNSSE